MALLLPISSHFLVGQSRHGWRSALLVALWLTAGTDTALAQAPVLTSLSPTRNLRNAPRAANVAATFSQPMNTGAASAASVKVFSQQRGGRMSGAQGGAASVSGNTITFNPTTDFKPGERVFTTITTAAQSSGGTNLATGHVYAFTAAAGAGLGTFSGGGNPGVGTSPWSVAVGDVDGDGDLDLLTANSNTNTVSVRLNGGDATGSNTGVFSGGTDPSVGSNPISVALGDVDGDGDLDLLAANSFSSASTVSVRLNGGDATGSNTGVFANGSTVSVGTTPWSVAVGDVDGDGDLDLLTANALTNTVSVRLNGGDATGSNTGVFSGGTDPSVGATPWSVAVGDVDGDGDLDLLTANSNTNTVSVRLNGGDATGSNTGVFSGGTAPSVGSNSTSVALGDVDGDGDLDLLAANGTANTVSVRLNGGDATGSNTGVFTNGSSTSVGSTPLSVAVGDVDGDGDLDLLTANAGAVSVSVRLNGGDATGSNTGVFANGSTLSVGTTPRSVALGDVDGDGDLDLLAANANASTVSVRFNQNAPVITALSPTRNLHNAARPSNVAVTFDQPMSSAAASAGAVKVFSQQRGGRMSGTQGGAANVSGNTITFNPTTDFKPGERVFATITTAAQSSGGASLARGHVYGFTAAAGAGPGTFSGGAESGVGGGSRSVAVGDVDGDGDLDLLTANATAASVSVRLNGGDATGSNTGVFANGSTTSVGIGPQSVVLGDVDGDGDLDLLAANANSASVSVRLNGGDATGSNTGVFSGGTDPSVGNTPISVAVGDVDGDGDLDLLTANSNSASVSVRLNGGDATGSNTGVFTNGSTTSVGNAPQSVALGDVDGDGDLDLLTANGFASSVSVRLNGGDATGSNTGVFSGGTDPSVGIAPRSVAVGDVDGDGDLDLLAANRNTNTVSVRLNGGDATGSNTGVFSGGTDISVDADPRSVALGDVDGDGDLDLLTANQSANTVSVRFNQNAAAPVITALSPTRNLPNAAATSSVAVTFDQPMSGAAASTGAVNVFAGQTGKRAGTASATGNTLALTPTADFRPGEVVDVTVTTAATSTGGAALATPHVYQFRTGAGAGPAVFTAGSNVSIAASPNDIAPADLDGDGDVDMLTSSQNNNIVSARFNDGTGVFSGGADYGFSNNLLGVIAPDVNADGTPDLVTWSFNQQIHVRFNTGTGTFSGGADYPFGATINSVKAGDMDGDGDLDLVASYGRFTSASGVLVLTNNGTGSFTLTQQLALAGAVNSAIALGDMDNDGDLDALVSNTSTVQIMTNPGSGVLVNQGVVAACNGNGLAVGDLDGDGDLDLVTCATNFNVYLNNGTGLSYTSGPTLPAGFNPFSAHLADLDGDGDLDLLAAAIDRWTRFLNPGDGLFGTGVSEAGGSTMLGIGAADIDGDGDLDVLVASRNQNQIWVRYNRAPVPVITALAPTRNLRNAAASANVAVTFSQPMSSSAASAGAVKVFSHQRGGLMNGTQGGAASVSGSTITFNPTTDFRPGESLFVTTSTAAQSSAGANLAAGHVHQFTAATGGTGRGNFVTPVFNPLTTVGGSVRGLVTGDVDGDGDLDVLTANQSASTVSVRLNDGTSVFSVPAANAEVSVGASPIGLALGDVDGDGDLDFLTYSFAGNTMSVRLNNGTGVFSAPAANAEVPTGAFAQAPTLGDVDGDGDLDLLFVRPSVHNVAVRLNDGTGNFTVPAANADVAVGTGPVVVSLNDVDGDGDLDFLALNNNSQTVSVRLNDGAGSFSVPAANANVPVGANPSALAVGDVDGDGDLDFLTYDNGTNTLSLRLNDGTGSFAPPAANATISPGANLTGVVLADMDADGDLDIVLGELGGQTAGVRLNDGAGNFTSPTIRSTALNISSSAYALGDLDADGDLDLIVGGTISTGVYGMTVRLNQVPPTVVSTNPARHSPAVPRTANVAVTFSRPVLNNAATAVSLSVRSEQRNGLMGGTGAVSGSTITFDPANTFRPGELLHAIVRGTRTTDGAPLQVPYVYQFTAAAGAGPAVFGGGQNLIVSANTAPALASGDVDNDGDADLVTITLPSGAGAGVAVYLNDGTGTLAPHPTTPVSVISLNSVQDMQLQDFEGDGDLDLLIGQNNRVTLMTNNGAGVFGLFQSFVLPASSNRLTQGDLDGDGDLDIVSANDNGTLTVVRNNGSSLGGGAISTSYTIGTRCYGVALGDVDNDGDLDLVGTELYNGGVVTILHNDGTGLFGTPTTTGGPRTGVALADIDDDGDLDLLTTVSGPSGTVDVQRNDGTGTFAAVSQSIPVGNTPEAIRTADFNGDGALDLIVPNALGNSLSVRLNTGNGTFATSGEEISVGSQTRKAVTVDLDGDGDLDVLAAGLFNNRVITRFNEVIDLVVSTPKEITGGTYRNITVTGTGIGTLTDPVAATGTVTVQDGGALVSNCQPLTGAGSFALQAGGTLSICDPAGISATGATGAVRVAGTRSFSSDAIYVYNGTAPQVTGTGLPATVRELAVQNPAGVTLTQPTAVRWALRLAAGVLATNSQPLTLLSTATRTAYAVHAGGSTSGAVTVERYIGGPTATGYRHLSSPVQSTTVADLTTAGFTPRVNAVYNTIPTPTLPASQFPNVFGFDETRGGPVNDFTLGYYSPATLADVLTPGRSWSVLMTGARTPDFVGNLTTGNVTMANLTRTGTFLANGEKSGWHLLGNPYPQPIDWDLATAAIPAGMSAAISIFRATSGNIGTYLTRTNGIGSLTDGIVPLGQGFFTRVTGAGPVSFTFTNALRVEANPATVARPAVENRPIVSLTLTDAQGLRDETFVYAEAGATPGPDDRFDGFKPGRNVGVPTLATLIGTEEAAINGLPESTLTQPTTVELLAVLPTPGIYELRVGQLLNLGGVRVELLDRLAGASYDLATNPVLHLRATRANEELTGRFALLFNGQRVTGDNSSSLIPHSSFTLFPNPAAGGAEVRVMGVAAGEVVRLLDATGRVVRTTTTAVLNTRELAAGVYTVRAAGGRTTRLVVE